MDWFYWLSRGGISLTLFLIAKLIHWSVNHSIERLDNYAENKGLSKLDVSDATKKAISQFSKYAIYGIAFLGVLYVFELNDLLIGIATAAGVSGIAIGFAAKDLISNSLSGLILVFDRPFSIGDKIEIGRWINKGKVQKIGIRNTVLKMRDGNLVTVPNSMVLSEFVVNYTRNPLNLVELIAGLKVGSDVNKAINLVQELIDGLDWRDNDNQAEVYITDVNDEQVLLKIKVWTRHKHIGNHKTKLFYAVNKLLKQHGINIKLASGGD